ncbi:MAG: hypothetical protein JRH20_14685 [Deltaproteobacteria bacterium]|nr:hypothetical protein [Deltaproteobacteria bacterium]
MAKVLRAQKPRQDFPWRSRSMERNVGRALIPFYPLVDKRGWVRRSALRKLYGTDTLRFYDAMLEQTHAGRGLSGITWDALLQRMPDFLREAMVAGQHLLPRMRAFSSIVRRYGKLRPTHLEMRGQILGNTAALLLRGGSVPRRTHVYGKTYSFDARAGTLLHAKGYGVEGTRFHDGAEYLQKNGGGLEPRLEGNPWAKIDQRETQRVEARIVAQINSVKHPERIKRPIFMMVDDGGDLLEVAARVLRRPEYRPYAHLFTAVEQTSKGHHKMVAIKPPFPVVSVAKCWAKTTYGNPMFGHAIAREARALLAELAKERRIFIPSDSRTMVEPQGSMMDGDGAPLEPPPGSAGDTKVIKLGTATTGRSQKVGGLKLGKKAVVIGANGSIGRGVIRSLMAAGYEVGGYDLAGVDAPPSGMKVYGSFDSALKAGDVIFSCTGKQTIGPPELEKMRHGAVVVNGGSAGEFHLPRILSGYTVAPLGAEQEGKLRVADRIIGHERFVRFKDSLVPVRGVDPHEVWVTKGGKEILIARGGGVINFPLDVGHPRAGKLIPGRYIQLEIGLLHLAMLQAQGETKPGVRELKRAPQEVLVKEVQAELSQRGESLLAPSW